MQSFGKGNRGNEVVDIQVRLSTLNYTLGPNGADGSFGELTEAAVKSFQRDRSLAVTGIVDQETWKTLVEATYKLGDRSLYLRFPFFRGDDVRELQLSLNTLGFNTGLVDGIYGQTTERAVREFQRNLGLPSDGIFGSTTLAAMRNLQHLLTNKASRVFPDPHRNQPSAISVFKDRKIAIDLDMQNGDGAIHINPEEAEISRELGLRLGNLLELLGADVCYLDGLDLRGLGNPDVFIGENADIYVGFKLNSDPSGKCCGSTILYQESDDTETKSQSLASAIQEEVIRSLGSSDLGVRPSSLKLKLGGITPATLIKPLFFTSPEEKSLLHEEVFRQKIAVAVFDGIKNYLQFP